MDMAPLDAAMVMPPDAETGAETDAETDGVARVATAHGTTPGTTTVPAKVTDPVALMDVDLAMVTATDPATVTNKIPALPRRLNFLARRSPMVYVERHGVLRNLQFVS